MFEAFWKELGSGLNKRWVTSAFVPALGFWIASLWAFGAKQGISNLINSWSQLDIYRSVGLIIIGVTVVVLTAVLLELLDAVLIRIYEGYWYGWPFGWLRKKLTSRIQDKLKEKKNKFSQLASRVVSQKASEKEQVEYEKLSLYLSNWPPHMDDIMPTRIGNILRAAESYPATRYGLDAVTVWPRLYFQLSDIIRDALTLSYAGMSALLRLATLGILYGLIWVPYFLWYRAWLLSLICALSFLLSWLCYQGAIQAATQYGIIVRTAFDLHRFDLYSALSWPRPLRLTDEHPSSDQSEIVLGQKLSLFLQRGQWMGDDLEYEHTKSKDKEENQQ